MSESSPAGLVGLRMTAILGISAFYHDSAAALIVDGKIRAAAQEEEVEASRPVYMNVFRVNIWGDPVTLSPFAD